MNLVNGVECNCIGVGDRGLAYGDGVFRTLMMRSSRPVLWKRQYEKLAADCAVLGIACPDAATFQRDLTAIATRHSDCVVKIIVTRGVGVRGYAIPATAAPTRIVAAAPLPEYPPTHLEHGVRIRMCRTRLAFQPALAGIKHLNRLENVLARSEWDDPDITEGLMCDADNNVICGTMSNLFLVKKGALLTPDLTRCGVAGVTRQRVIDCAREIGVPARTIAIRVADVFDADELFLVNSVIGLWPVAALERVTWHSGQLAARILACLSNAQEREQ